MIRRFVGERSSWFGQFGVDNCRVLDDTLCDNQCVAKILVATRDVVAVEPTIALEQPQSRENHSKSKRYKPYSAYRGNDMLTIIFEVVRLQLSKELVEFDTLLGRKRERHIIARRAEHLVEREQLFRYRLNAIGELHQLRRKNIYPLVVDRSAIDDKSREKSVLHIGY